MANGDTGDDVVTGARPTRLILPPNTESENSPVGTVVGEVEGVDPDPGDKHTSAMVPGSGAGANGSFTVEGDVAADGCGHGLSVPTRPDPDF